MSTRRHDVAGQRFGRWVALSFSHRDEARRAFWTCRCDCGTERAVTSYLLTTGRSQSCGCIRREKARSKVAENRKGKRVRFPGYSAAHREHPTEAIAFWSMISRVHGQSNSRNVRNYAERGLTICDRWLYGEAELSGFQCFLADMGERPKDRHSLDRIDNDKGYSPQNCRWATRKQQIRNRRVTLKVQVFGEDIAFAEACERSGLDYTRAYERLRSGVHPEVIFAGLSHG